MTSGQFHSFAISSINTNRDARQRRELRNIDTLAESIKECGLIHPPVIQRDGTLVVGERRVEACKLLGWTHISVQYIDELEEAELKKVELEENIKRENIPWQDEVRAVYDYCQILKIQDPQLIDSSARAKAATRLGRSIGDIFSKFRLAEEILSGNKEIAAIPEYSTARGRVQRADERKSEKAIADIQAAAQSPHPDAPPPESIFVADFNEWAPLYKGPRFNFLHCDFPYGIGADKFNQGAANSHGGYEDTPEHFWKLVGTLNNTPGLTTESCHLMFWFAMRKGRERLYEEIAATLEQGGWYVNPMPLIWMKTDGSGIIPDPERDPRQIYETAFLCSRGDRKIVRAVANAYGAPVVQSRHMSEKPEPVLRHFFRMLVDENTIMLDPTCGSGSSLRAAESLNAGHCIGLEINGEFAERAMAALKSARSFRKLMPAS